MQRNLIDHDTATPIGVRFRDDPSANPGEVPPEGRRLKVFFISPEFLVGLFDTAGTFRVEANRLPEDARPVSISYDVTRHVFVLVIESVTFDPVPHGAIIPWADAVAIRKIEDVSGRRGEPPLP
jgi:hypothetical protein